MASWQEYEQIADLARKDPAYSSFYGVTARAPYGGDFGASGGTIPTPSGPLALQNPHNWDSYGQFDYLPNFGQSWAAQQRLLTPESTDYWNNRTEFARQYYQQAGKMPDVSAFPLGGATPVNRTGSGVGVPPDKQLPPGTRLSYDQTVQMLGGRMPDFGGSLGGFSPGYQQTGFYTAPAQQQAQAAFAQQRADAQRQSQQDASLTALNNSFSQPLNLGIAAPGESVATRAFSGANAPQGTTSNTLSPSDLASLQTSYQSAYDSARKANVELYNRTLQGYQDRMTGLSGMLGVIGQNQLDQAGRYYDQQGAAAQSSAIARGLGNTTVTDALQSGVNAQRAQDFQGIYNNVAQQQMNTLQGLSGDYLSYMERGGQTPYPDFSTIAGIGTTGASLSQQKQLTEESLANQRSIAQAQLQNQQSLLQQQLDFQRWIRENPIVRSSSFSQGPNSVPPAGAGSGGIVGNFGQTFPQRTGSVTYG